MVRRHLVRRHLVRCHLVRCHLVVQRLVQCLLERCVLVRPVLVWGHLVRTLLVRTLLVRCLLGRTTTQLRVERTSLSRLGEPRPSDGSGPSARPPHIPLGRDHRGPCRHGGRSSHREARRTDLTPSEIDGQSGFESSPIRPIRCDLDHVRSRVPRYRAPRRRQGRVDGLMSPC